MDKTQPLIINALKAYRPISLDEMSGIRLMNRTDTKFVTTVPRLMQLLALARGQYRAQEIGASRLARYYTLYFDTPGCEMYMAHHGGRAPRQKVRIRTYVDSGTSFLEVKTKNNHARTRKKRAPFAPASLLQQPADLAFEPHNGQLAGCMAFLRSHMEGDPQRLRPMIENRFGRVTLVNNALTERLTIDLGLQFHNLVTGRQLALPSIAIIELKRDGLLPSPILNMLLSLRIKPMGFSKYCLGSALTRPALKQNRFKPRLHQLERLAAQ